MSFFKERTAWTNNFIFVEGGKGTEAGVIARQINALGFKTKAGKRWNAARVRQRLSNLKHLDFTVDAKVLQQGPPALPDGGYLPKRQRRTTRRTVQTKEPRESKSSTTDRKALTELIIDSALKKEQKLRLLGELL